VCASIFLQITEKSNSEYFGKRWIERCQIVFGYIYDYTSARYINAKTDIEIVCGKHGSFWQKPYNHLRGNGCPKCSRALRWAGSLKEQCKALGIDYWRAQKRSEAGMPLAKVLCAQYVRADRKTAGAVTIHGEAFPNLEAARRVLRPIAASTTIARWIKNGATPEEAFSRIPNPGYAQGAIYLVTHTESGKQYVGLTVRPVPRRWSDHIQTALKATESSPSLQAAIRRYGESAFTVEQIDSGTTKADLEAKERHHIAVYGSQVPAGYNISAGGSSGGSTPQPTSIDGRNFPSKKEADAFIAATWNISVHAAKARRRSGRLDVVSPPKPGLGLAHTPAYKAWSRIIHGVANPNSKSFLPNLQVDPRWRIFANFLSDLGQPPGVGYALSRLDKEIGFVTANCVWLTRSESSKRNASWMLHQGKLKGRALPAAAP
jgi:hypothetical protein